MHTNHIYKANHENHSHWLYMRKRLFASGAWALAGKLVTVAGAFLTNVLLTRLMTPEEMGVYFLAFSLASVAAFISQLGMPQTAVRLVAKYSGQMEMGIVRNVVKRMLIYVLISLSLIVALLMGGLGKWIANNILHSLLLSGLVIITSLWIIPIVIQTLLGEIFRGLSDIRLAALFSGNNTGGGAFSVLLLLLVLSITWLLYGQLSIKDALLISLGCSSMGATVALLIAWRVLSATTDVELEHENLLEGGGQILAINLASWAISQSDVWFIGAHYSEFEVSYYAAASKLALLIPFALLVVNSVISPMISNLYYQGKKAELEHLLRRSAWLSALPAIVMVLIFAIWGREILGLLFGNHYREGGVVLIILSAGLLINVLTGSCGMTMLMTGHSKPLMWIVILSAIITLFILTAIASYGIEWVAFGIAFGQCLHSVSTWLYVRREMGIWTHVSTF